MTSLTLFPQIKELSVLKSLRELKDLKIKGNKIQDSHKKTIARELGYKIGEVDSKTFRNAISSK